jgi:hypothetical protein
LDVKLARAPVDAIGMRARFLAVILALAALIIAAPAAAADDWLGEINRYRAAAGEPAVVDQPSLDAALAAHLKYLENDQAYETGQYASPHTENPAAPDHTNAGTTEGARSDIALGSPGVFASGTAAVDSWWESPFHAIGMLRPGLTYVALALAPDGGAAALDILTGLGAGSASSPVLFPGNGIVTNLSAYSGSEFPDPLPSCGWPDSGRYGLPLIALLPQAPAAGLSATLAGPAGNESSAAGTLCIVDEDTYVSPDPTFGPTGLEILEGDQAVLLIPRSPLANGGYTADITQQGQPDVIWSFSEGTVPAPAPAPGPTPAPTGTGTGTTPAPVLPTAPTGTTGTTGTTGKTGATGTTGTSGSTPVTPGTAHPILTLVAHRGRLTLRGRGTATVTVTATRHGRRLAQRTFRERGAHWRAALRLPRGLHGARVTVTLRIVRDGRTTVLHRRLAL